MQSQNKYVFEFITTVFNKAKLLHLLRRKNAFTRTQSHFLIILHNAFSLDLI